MHAAPSPIDWVRAEQYFASALRRGYPDTVVIPKLLRVCLGASRLRAALGYAEIYLLRHPRAWELRYLAGAIHVGLGQPDAARAELEHVLRAQPAHAPATFLLAQLEAAAPARLAQARELYTSYLALAPDGAHAEAARTFLQVHASDPSPTESEDATSP